MYTVLSYASYAVEYTAIEAYISEVIVAKEVDKFIEKYNVCETAYANLVPNLNINDLEVLASEIRDLRVAIDAASYTETDYTPASWTEYSAAVSHLYDLISKATSKSADISTAVTNLQDAEKALTPKSKDNVNNGGLSPLVIGGIVGGGVVFIGFIALLTTFMKPKKKAAN